jgi:tetratricopeptide (TPR) repeat protein
LRLKRYKWVEEFIKKYSCELPEEIRNDEVNMAYARLYFFKGEYQNAIEMLTRGKSSNYLFNLDVSRLKLRIYYEISEFDEAFLEIDRLRHYMKNNIKRIARTVRQYNKEFLDFYYMLLKLKLNPDKNELSYVKQKISDSKTLVTKVWFTEKISEMKS